MIWLKKVTLFILSVCFLILISCKSNNNESELKQEKISKETLITNLFNHLQSWNKQTIPLIDSIGFHISKIDSSLRYLPYTNEYAPNSFVFITKDRKAFKPFEESSFLSESKKFQKQNYSVWRKKINGAQILDISIEPHPTLSFILCIRLRIQE